MSGFLLVRGRVGFTDARASGLLEGLRMTSTNGFSSGALVVFGLALLGTVGCGGRGVVAGDGGADTSTEAPAMGLRAFDIVAALSSPADGGVMGSQLPATNRFTLVLDATEHRIIAGGNGTGTVVPVTTSDGKSFRTTQPFDTATPPLGTCGNSARIHYTTLDFTVVGTTLTGHATGTVDISCGDCTFALAFVAELAGGADRTPPTLVSGAIQADPFDDFVLLTSEPLPVGATARVVDSDGFGVDLAPIIYPGDDGGAPAVVVGFAKTKVVLGVGGGYSVELGGLVDFAGLRGTTATALRLGSFAPPPLVSDDGFESATGKTVGGAALVKTGTQAGLEPLAGTQSVYLGASAVPFAAKIGAGPRFLVRLAVPPDATKVLYTARAVGPMGSGFAGSVALGFVGKTRVVQSAFDLRTTQPTPVVVDGVSVDVSDIKTQEVLLPPDVTDELVFEISTFEFSCGLPGERPAGLLIDDLRVE
jgi:hypothetical protein